MTTTTLEAKTSPDRDGWTGEKCPRCKGHGTVTEDGGFAEVRCNGCGGTGDEYVRELDEREPPEPSVASMGLSRDFGKDQADRKIPADPDDIRAAYLDAATERDKAGWTGTVADCIRGLNEDLTNYEKRIRDTDFRQIALDAMSEARQAGESREMCARWIAERIRKALASG